MDKILITLQNQLIGLPLAVHAPTLLFSQKTADNLSPLSEYFVQTSIIFLPLAITVIV